MVESFVICEDCEVVLVIKNQKRVRYPPYPVKDVGDFLYLELKFQEQLLLIVEFGKQIIQFIMIIRLIYLTPNCRRCNI